jgi:cytochrome c-type biogenesis protein
MNGLLTLAFTAGLLAPVNPCGFALLPAYLGYTAADQAEQPVSGRLVRALGVGAALGVGFAATLGGAGLAISAGAHLIVTAAPWLGFSVGLVLVVLGVVALTGRGPAVRLRLPLPTIRAPRSSSGVVWWVLFGVGYGIASLACTFAVLLAVIVQAQAATGVAGQAVVFAAYTAGSLALLLPLSVVAALAGAAAARASRALCGWQPVITAGLLILTGGYVAAYWWPAITHAAPTGHGLRSLDRWSADLATWLQSHDALVAGLAGGIILLVAGARLWANAGATRRHMPAAAAPDEDGCPPADGQPPTPGLEHRGAASRQ